MLTQSSQLVLRPTLRPTSRTILQPSRLRLSQLAAFGLALLLGSVEALAQQQAQAPFSTWSQFLPIIILVAAFYFVMIRPQMKRQKEHRAMLQALAPGDEVVAAGGLLGRVTKLSDSYVHIEVANGVELQVQRLSVAAVLPKGTIKK